VAGVTVDDEVPYRVPKVVKGGSKLRIVVSELAEVDFEDT